MQAVRVDGGRCERGAGQTEDAQPLDEQLGKLGQQKPRRAHLPGQSLRGISLNSTPVLTPAGLPLGLAAVKFWARQVFKGTNTLKRKINPTRVPIKEKESLSWPLNLQPLTATFGEAARCVHVDDREGDIYELFRCAGNRWAGEWHA